MILQKKRKKENASYAIQKVYTFNNKKNFPCHPKTIHIKQKET